MKSYIVEVLYCTQRNIFRVHHLVDAKNPVMAKYIILGIILDSEHKQKDRYIKIKSLEVKEF